MVKILFPVHCICIALGSWINCWCYEKNCITCLITWPLFIVLKTWTWDCSVEIVTSIVVMSWPLLLGGLLLSASAAMSVFLRPRYDMFPMSYPLKPLPYPPVMPVQLLRANRTINVLSYNPYQKPENPYHDPRLPHRHYNRRVRAEIKRRTEAMMRRNSPSMKKIAARIALFGMVPLIVLLLLFCRADIRIIHTIMWSSVKFSLSLLEDISWPIRWPGVSLNWPIWAYDYF